MSLRERPIGFFDSGVGGISVLRQAVKVLPSENFVYFGDSKNAPYGTKTVDEVKKLTFNAVDFLISKDIKALVIACNTATSAAIIDLRERYGKTIPVIGIEPALKPAVELKRKGKVIIMATPMTLSEKKFNNLMKKYDKIAEIQPLPCPGLVELIENGVFYGVQVENYLRNRIKDFKEDGIASVVLGCTHYPFIKDSLKKILDEDVPIIDGSEGTARQLKRQLSKYSLINQTDIRGNIEMFNSLENNEMINLSHKLLTYNR